MHRKLDVFLFIQDFKMDTDIALLVHVNMEN